MKPVYIDIDFKCHTSNPFGTFRKVEEPLFNDKCDAFVEGFRLKPEGEIWVREDGKVFSGGKMITPWKNYDELAAAQAQYERDMAELAAAYKEGVDSV